MSSPAVTLWTNDPLRGYLVSKTCADGRSVLYSNSPAGRLRGRTRARGVTASCEPNWFGAVAGISYSLGRDARGELPI